MFRQRVAEHYRRAGWAVDAAPPPAPTGRPFRADLVVRKGKVTQAVLIREEPPGPFEVGEFGAQCRARKLRGVVVAPDDARVLDLCEQAGLDFLPGESIGEIVVVGRAPEPAPTVTAAPTQPPARRPAAETVAVPAPTPWWRWAIVAAIWTAALVLIGYDLWKLGAT